MSEARPSVDDQRRFTRHEVRGEAKLEPLHEHEQLDRAMDVGLWDIGRTGVKFATDRPLPVGSAWRLRIVRHGHQVATLPLVVRHNHPGRVGQFLIGAQFMIEPFILSALGVSEHDLCLEDLSGGLDDQPRFEGAEEARLD